MFELLFSFLPYVVSFSFLGPGLDLALLPFGYADLGVDLLTPPDLLTPLHSLEEINGPLISSSESGLSAIRSPSKVVFQWSASDIRTLSASRCLAILSLLLVSIIFPVFSLAMRSCVSFALSVVSAASILDVGALSLFHC